MSSPLDLLRPPVFYGGEKSREFKRASQTSKTHLLQRLDLKIFGQREEDDESDGGDARNIHQKGQKMARASGNRLWPGTVDRF